MVAATGQVTASTLLLVPVALGAALLGERLAGHHGVGMGLIGLGLAAIDGRPLRAVRVAFGRRAVRAATTPAVRADGPRRGDR